MFKNNKLNKITISLGLGVILTLVAEFNSSTYAQSRYDNEGYQPNEKSTVFGDAPAGLDPIDLMHRAQQSNRRSAAEFNEEYQGQLDSSVSDFKQLQQQRILEQQQQPAATPAKSPGAEPK